MSRYLIGLGSRTDAEIMTVRARSMGGAIAFAKRRFEERYGSHPTWIETAGVVT